MHSPPPWFVWQTEISGRKAWVVTAVPEEDWTPQHRVIATIFGHDDVSIANARLIAQAPSTSKALEAAKRALTNPVNAGTKKAAFLSFSGILPDSLDEELKQARRKSKIQQIAVTPLWRVFTASCVIWTTGWTAYWLLKLVVETWEL